eukprot:XP_027304060.1 collagen alpha-2(I) chain-like [Anas platyrhynchos]
MQLHKREAYVVVLASGKTSKTIVVIRSKNGKAAGRQRRGPARPRRGAHLAGRGGGTASDGGRRAAGSGGLPQLVSSGLAPAGSLGLKRVGDAPRKARPGWVPPCQAPASYWGGLSGPPPPQRRGCPGGIGWKKKAKRPRGERLSLRGAGEAESLLCQLQENFEALTEKITLRMEEMGERIDDLEKHVADLMTEAGIENTDEESRVKKLYFSSLK